MISRLLKKNINISRLVCYTIANIVGLAILLTAVKFYSDVTAGKTDPSDTPGGHIVLQKPVPLLSIATGNDRTRFTDDEITELKAQPWVKSIAPFTAADFNVTASINYGGQCLSTALFFESLPDTYVDTDTAKWHFDPVKRDVPVLIPREYLALYNFGFAASRNMPQMSEDLITNIPFRIIVAGNGRSDVFRGHIAGLSSKLNTIAVPQEFMDWANERYGDGTTHSPSRLMIETDNPGDPAIADWLETNGIEVAGDTLSSGRSAYIAGITSSLVAIIGVVISLLSIALLMLSIYLIVEKNRDTIRNLTLLGYTTRQIARFYNSIILMLNTSVSAVAVILSLTASCFWRGPLASAGYDGSGIWPVIITAIVVMGLATIAAIFSVRRLINHTAI